MPPGAGVEQSVIERAGLRLSLTLESVEAEFVDQQEIEPSVFLQHSIEAPVGQGLGELLEQLGAGRIAYTVSQNTCGLTNSLENPRLAQARLTHQNHILASAHEVACNQLLNAPPIQPLGVELPVKAFQGSSVRGIVPCPVGV